MMNDRMRVSDLAIRHSTFDIRHSTLDIPMTAEERRRCLRAGCDDFATKPILPDALCAVILRNLQHERVGEPAVV